MRRVLIVMENEDVLVESANKERSVQNRESDVSIDDVIFNSPGRSIASDSTQASDLPSNMIIDDQFAAIPIGTGEDTSNLDAFVPENSAKFAVRAMVTEEMAQEGYVNGKPIYSDLDIAPFAVCPGDPALGDTDDVKALHSVGSVHARGLKGNRVAVAIMDTGISARHLADQGLTNVVDRSVTWNPMDMISRQGRIIPSGAHPEGHGTMCAFDTLIAAPEARLLDYPIISRLGGSNGASSMAGALSDALQAYTHLEAFWSVAFNPARHNYDSLVINNSWGVYHPDWDFGAGHPGRYIDNPEHPFNLRVASMAANDIDILFAAGNCGSECPAGRCDGVVTHSIRGANAHPDVLTLAGVDTNGGRVGYSSEGPPVPGMGNGEKPDLAAATHFDGSQVDGRPDSGTSAACPVASGCVAAIRSAIPQSAMPPSTMYDGFRQTAVSSSGGDGWNAQTGFGIIDLEAVASHFGV